MKKNFLKAVVFLPLIVLFIFFLIPLVQEGLKKEETRECQQWQKWAKEKKEVFFLTSWQKEQCSSLGIVIDAPVKTKKPSEKRG